MRRTANAPGRLGIADNSHFFEIGRAGHGAECECRAEYSGAGQGEGQGRRQKYCRFFHRKSSKQNDLKSFKHSLERVVNGNNKHYQ